MTPFIRLNPNRQDPNEPQFGKVKALCFKPADVPGHIKREPVDHLMFDATGSIGDYHSRYLVSYHNILRLLEGVKRNEIMPITQLKTIEGARENLKNGFRLFKLMQVHLLDTFTAKMFSEGLNVDIYPGAIGDQVLIDGVDLNMLHQGTIISIGSNVKFQVISSRTFCHKFLYDLTDPVEGRDRKEFFSAVKELIINTDTKVAPSINSKVCPPHIGILVKVIAGGRIDIGDDVYIDPTASKYYNFKSRTPIIPRLAIETLDWRYQWFNREQLEQVDRVSSAADFKAYFDDYYFEEE